MQVLALLGICNLDITSTSVSNLTIGVVTMSCLGSSTRPGVVPFIRSSSCSCDLSKRQGLSFSEGATIASRRLSHGWVSVALVVSSSGTH